MTDTIQSELKSVISDNAILSKLNEELRSENLQLKQAIERLMADHKQMLEKIRRQGWEKSWTPARLQKPAAGDLVEARCTVLMYIVCYWDGDKWMGMDGMPLPVEVTHWRPFLKSEEVKP